MISGYKASVIVNHSLDECKKRIQRLNERDILHYNRVQFWQADERTIDYEIRLRRFNGFLGTVSGDLSYQDNQTTLITCKAELAAIFKLGISVYMLLALLFILTDLLHGQFPVGIVLILWGILWWVIWTWRCNLFAESLMDKLQQV